MYIEQIMHNIFVTISWHTALHPGDAPDLRPAREQHPPLGFCSTRNNGVRNGGCLGGHAAMTPT